jgi:hypothetical protein
MAKKLIGVNARITEVNRYDFCVEVDENATKEQQDKEAVDKVKKFLEGNIPSPNLGSEFIGGVRCVDVEYGIAIVRGEELTIEDEIEINDGF